MIISDNVLYGGTVANIPAHLSFAQYVIDKLRDEEDGVAFVNVETGEELTRRGLLQLSVNLATSLFKLGVRKGDVVTLCSENRTEYMVAVLATLYCGASVTTANVAYTEYELNHIMNISKPIFMFCSATALKKHIKSFQKFKFLKKLIQFDDSTIDTSVVLYNTLVSGHVDVTNFMAVDVEGYLDPAFILYSSGTTGLPKGVILTHVNVLFFGFSGKHAYSRYLTIVPWYHAYGMLSTLTYVATGRSMHFMTSFIPDMYLNAVQKYKIEVLITVPPMIVFFNKSPTMSQYDVTSVRSITSAAAPLTRDTIEEAMKRFPNCNGIKQAYGMTETCLAVSVDPEGEGAKHKSGSGGPLVPGMRVKIVDLESRRKLGAYERGEICAKGPNLMKGYMGNEAATREILDDEGYLKTGDVGYYDEDGYIFIVDRLKELIKYKGHQVAPAEVESVLLQHPAVSECGVVGACDERCGERATAFVLLKPGANVTESELVQHVANKLSVPKQLHGGVIFASEIPKNPSGKILRRVLKERLASSHTSKL